MSTEEEPLLRTLAPALRRLGNELRGWLDSPHLFPRSTLTQASLEGLATDLHRQGQALDVDRPLLVVLFMGGTGVGKSSLLNALAGAPIAQASFTRPTTRDPVVYYHQSVRPEQLDPALRLCRLVSHDRDDLRQKVLVDSPDLDSNELANRETLRRLLPASDVVLYVGSQEKYHDQIGWQMFVEQRHRHAFAFVLNKWDRCLQGARTGVRPDEDMLRDLRQEGFERPLLFRVCAQYWIDARPAEPPGTPGGPPTPGGTPPADPASAGPLSSGPSTSATPPPEGEQFPDLVRWLEQGLTRVEIEAIKARGVSQLLQQLEKALDQAAAPDLTDPAARVRDRWHRVLDDEAAAASDVLLETLVPYQREIEHHFTVEGQRRFRGLMAGYLNLFTRVKYAGNTIRDRLPWLPRPASAVHTAETWDLATFTGACSKAASERQLDARSRALGNRILVEADQLGFPLGLLTAAVEAAGSLDWRQKHARSLIEALQHVEQQWSRPTGVRRGVQGVIVFLADWAPQATFLGGYAVVFWNMFMRDRPTGVQDFLLPLIAVLIVLLVLQVLINLLLPLRWHAIRGEFHKQLRKRLEADLDTAYAGIPAETARVLLQERRRVADLTRETAEVAAWLKERERRANVDDLYGGRSP